MVAVVGAVVELGVLREVCVLEEGVYFSLSCRTPLMDWEPCQCDRQGSAGR